MKKLSLLSAPILLLALVAVPAVHAGPANSARLEQRLKESFNGMVQKVRATEDPAAKREIIGGFLTRMDRGLGLMEKISPASGANHAQAVQLRAKMQAHRVELNNPDMQGPTAGGNLNAFASYLQQDVEQADGLFISAGALIIILLILLILL